MFAVRSPSILTRSSRRSSVRRHASASGLRNSSFVTNEVLRVEKDETARDFALLQVYLFRGQTFLGSHVFGLTRPIAIGRASKSTLALKGDTVSRAHCRLLVENGEVMIEDLGSANGTYVNRIRVQGIRTIQPSDSIHVGAYVLRVRGLHATSPFDPVEDTSRTTRVEAVLSMDDGEEAAFDVTRAPKLNRKMYESALLRGGASEEPTAAPIEIKSRASSLRVVSIRPEARIERLDPKAEARLRDLDKLIALLDEKERLVKKSNGGRLLAIDGYRGRSLTPAPRRDTGDLARDFVSSFEEGALIAEKHPPTQVDAAPPATDEQPDEGLPRTDELVIINVPVLREENTEPSVRAAHLPRQGTPSPIPPSSPPPALRRFGTIPSVPIRLGEDSTSEVMDASQLTSPGEDTPDNFRAPKEICYDDVWTSASQLIVAPPAFAVEQRAVQEHAGVEVSARSRGNIVQLARLLEPGDEYVLGHKNDAGQMAPASAHVGLRMLRINDDRSIDLVFPQDVEGDLMRDGETIPLQSLTEGREYSCLRLEPRDLIAVTLGRGARAISYHVRFIERS